MAFENITDLPAEFTTEMVSYLGSIALWLQAIGILAVIWIGIQIFNIIRGTKRKHDFKKIQDDLKRIERKLDHIKKKK